MDKVISKGVLTALMFYDKSDYILINDDLIKHRELEYGCGVCHHGVQVSASIREFGRNKMSQNLQTQRESQWHLSLLKYFLCYAGQWR